MSTHRSTKDGPFCWQSKAVRRHIREAFDATHDVTTALGVYDALTEIASDAGKETFATTHAWIQRISGVSVRTIQAHLKAFSGLGLVKITTPKLRAPSTYILLTFGNGCATLGNDCATFGNQSIQPSLPTSEERLKKIEEPCAPAKPTRKRNALLDALAAIDGSDPAQVTGKAWGAIGTALKEIREVFPQVTPDEIKRRAGNYRQHMPEATISANALAKHWARCDRPPQAQPAQHPTRNYPLLTA